MSQPSGGSGKREAAGAAGAPRARTAWEDAVLRGDSALASGDLQRAGNIYRDLLKSLTPLRVANQANEAVGTAVVVHRIAVVEFASADAERAEQIFSEVDAELTRVVELAGPTQRRYVELVRDQSRMQHDLLLTGQVPRMTAVCQHGCPWITTHCPYTEPHC